jgi:hypothetical protein
MPNGPETICPEKHQTTQPHFTPRPSELLPNKKVVISIRPKKKAGSFLPA